MGELNGKCGDGVEMMVENNFPSFFLSLSFFFLKYNVDKKRNDEKGAEDGGI